MAGSFARSLEETGGFRGVVVVVVFDLGWTVIRGSVLQYIEHILSGQNSFFLQSQFLAQDSEMPLNEVAALQAKRFAIHQTHSLMSHLFLLL